MADARPLDPAKFRNPALTAGGEKRATVAIERLDTLWINTGTLCNLACRTCYIESSPTNDALVYLRLAEAEAYFDEAGAHGTRTIGFTGGEPFMNREMVPMMGAALARGFDLLVLTNAMRPMRRFESALLEMARAHGERVVMRVSLDDWRQSPHEAERGAETWEKALDGLVWLARAGFRVAVAGRRAGSEAEARTGYGQLFDRLGIEVDHLVLFPTMDASADVPEITDACWDILRVSPEAMMCASSRMVVKAKGAERPHVVACTLLPYDPGFAMGETLGEAMRPVALNHPHCARFCVLGGARCTG
ncbi:radical SAM protein [Sphingosinicella sp. CPCC 101087]|uniref:radical SAM protein n=1 Tax=Sphingosinicella sp. CPCC 101087 TaxID=2497754 RepID=UPI001FB130E0|nr:radical SAM protein [Sphingosinicella sp. CPCC 101087]